jgi:NAD(P)-dependent dehydrogenase (short-subunit alcohol dehydrogenase family)
VADVTTEQGAAHMVAQAEQAFGKPVDTLVHLVGGFAMGPLDAPDAPATWERLMALNLDSAFHCYRAVLPALRARGGGWIVGVASRAAVSPPARMAAYAASKAGVIALTQSLSAELRGAGIHVNVILPSTIDTPANRQEMGDDAAKNWVRADDIADATLYLCSEKARAIHGATLEIYANS